VVGEIVCRDVVKRFGARSALDRASFAVRAGEIVALLGPNGAGKSTALSILATLLAPTSGEVAVAGCALPREARRARRHLGLVPQQVAVYPALSARENLEYFAALQGLAGDGARSAVGRALALVELADRADEPVARFSGGMARRLNLACGIVHRPLVVLLDEPTVGVDPQARERIYELERALAAEGAAVLHSTHLMEEAERLADRVVLLDRGRVIADGTTRELVERARLRPRLVLRTARPLPGGWADGVPGVVADVEPAPAAEPGATSERSAVLTIDSTASVPAILERARAAGGEIDDVALHRPDLADVFFHLTGRALRDDDREPAP